MVHGWLSIQTPIVNKAYVVADNQTLDLFYLDPRSSTASKAYWIAEQHPQEGTVGTLLIRESVGGGGTWQLLSHPDAKIWIAAPCERNTGKVEITHGTFEVGEDVDGGDNFATTGTLTMQSVNGSQPKIYVHEGQSAKFDN
jgi:hypothetical protein